MPRKAMIGLAIVSCSLLVLGLGTSLACQQTVGREARFGGLGITVAQLYDQDSPDHLGEIVILDVLPDSPGRAGGLKPGEVITAVNGVSTKGKSFGGVVLDHLRGPVGSAVELEVRTVPKGPARTVRLVRAEIAG